MSRLFGEMRSLVDSAGLYTDLMTPENEVRVCVELPDVKEAVTLVLGKHPEVLEGSVDPDARLYMSRPVFERILAGEADMFSLIARARSTDTRLVGFEISSKDRAAEVWETGKALLTYMFLPGRIKVRRLSPEVAGEAHGAHPVPLVYWDGVRAAWYYLRRGQTANEAGEKDPWPQLFIILRGKGKATVGEEEFDVESNSAFYIPTMTVHKIHAETDVECIWIAWRARPF